MKKFLRWVPIFTLVLAITFTVMLSWQENSIVKANADNDLDMYSYDRYKEWYDKYHKAVNGNGITLTGWDNDRNEPNAKKLYVEGKSSPIDMSEKVDWRKLAGLTGSSEAPCRYWFWVKLKKHLV